MRDNSNNLGFTLNELLFVLLVFGLLLVIALPSLSRFLTSSRLAGSANELIADIHYARSLAVAKRKSFHIEFDVDEYRIVETSSGSVVRTRALPTGLNCAASADPNFYAWGLADPVDIRITGVYSTRTLALSANGNVSRY